MKAMLCVAIVLSPAIRGKVKASSEVSCGTLSNSTAAVKFLLLHSPQIAPFPLVLSPHYYRHLGADADIVSHCCLSRDRTGTLLFV